MMKCIVGSVNLLDLRANAVRPYGVGVQPLTRANFAGG